jgi:hypothetical protein
LIGLCCVFLFLLGGQKKEIILLFNKEKISSSPTGEASLSEFKPYNGVYTLSINPVTALDGMSLQEIADFRIGKVNEYSILNIFPPDYNPLKLPHSKIYNSITSGADWLHPAQFYISNPYLLIVVTCANHVTPLALGFYHKEVRYSNLAIEEIYEGEDARKWFRQLYSYEDYPGVIRIWTVNACDACLFYTNVDKRRTVNIDFSWNNSPGNITNTIYNLSEFFHTGRYGKNNLSPANANGRIKLLNRDSYTCIYIKLWRKRPQNINQKEDFAYIIKIIP